MILDFAMYVLKDAGYTVHSSNSPFTALKVLQEKKFDLVITDIKMPEMSGLEMIKKVQKINHEIKFVIMTGFGDLESARVAIKAGAYDYILKPFDIETLRLSVDNVFKRKRLEDENARLKELANLFRVSKVISSDFNSRNLLQLIINSIIAQVQATQGSIMLLDPDTNTLKIAAAVGLDDEIINSTRLKVGEGVAGRVILYGKPVLVTNIDNHPLFDKVGQCYPDKSFVSIPMKINEEIIAYPLTTSKAVVGVINVRRKEDTVFTEADIELISVMASQAAVAIENNRLFTDLNNVYLQIMQCMVELTEARDSYLRGHSQRVNELCIRLAQAMEMKEPELNNLKYVATLHDIGKLAISETLLNKPGKLTKEEFNIIKTHPAVGANILRPLKFLHKAREVIYHHHERFDGKGYPSEIFGDQLTLPMNIIILADAFDAMSSDRAYRKALSKEEIMEEIISNKGKQFHPKVVEVFLKLYKNNNEFRLNRTILV
jgi:putative nucleotidyltransferase with HDIG domain